MAKVVYRDKQKSVFISHAEAVLLFAVEFGTQFLDAFFPAKYPQTWWTRRLLGLDSVSRANIRLAKHRLIRQGLVAHRRDSSCRITRRGSAVAAKLMALFRQRNRPVWDGQWRIVVFDIPEKMKKYREALRRELVEAGYLRLQDSVWIGKLPLPDDAFEFIEACDLDRYIFLFLAAVVDKDEELARLFRRAAA